MEEQSFQTNQTMQEEQSNNEVELQPRKKRKWLKITLWLIGVLIFLTVLLFSLPFIFSALWGKDDPLPNDTDLLLSTVNIPDNENSYFDLQKLKTYQITIPDDIKIENYSESYSWDIDSIANLLIKNQAVIKTFNETAIKSKFQIAETADADKIDLSTYLPSMNSWWQTARLAAINSVYLMRQGKEDIAFAQAINIIKVGSDIENSKNIPTITYLVGNTIHQTGLEIMQVLISNTSLAPEILTLIQSKISEYNPKNNSDFLRLEYMSFKKTITSNNNSSLFGEMVDRAYRLSQFSYYFKPNQTLAIMADINREQIERLAIPCNENSTDLNTKTEISWKIYFTENAAGKMLTNLYTPVSGGIRNKRCTIDALTNLTNTLFDLKKYRMLNGSYPQNLQELNPGDSSSLHIDPFTSELFAIDTKNMNIRSFGLNHKDNNGGDDDISLSFDFAATTTKIEPIIEPEIKAELDSDNDGLPDSEELKYGTDPNNSDTDGDGYSDSQEISHGYDPLHK